jgi:putative transposase
MGRLRHCTSPDWTYFVTTKTWQSTFVFQVRETAEIVVRKILEYRDRRNYLLHEFVLMPNHLHLLLTPSPSVTLEKVIQLIKGGSSHEIHKVRGSDVPIWQSGFHESRVRDWLDYKKKSDYVRFNPVAAKLVEQPQGWRFGSASGHYQLDPIPQRLKPDSNQPNVGPKGPTPNVDALTRGLKPPPPKEAR